MQFISQVQTAALKVLLQAMLATVIYAVILRCWQHACMLRTNAVLRCAVVCDSTLAWLHMWLGSLLL